MAQPWKVEALTFDVFGTVVDWRGTIITEGRTLAPAVDWGSFADRWRTEGYLHPIRRMVAGEEEWRPIDSVMRAHLDALARDFQLAPEVVDRLEGVWERLDPWPDAPTGLDRLRSGYVIAPLSNGSFASLTRMARHAGLRWDCVFATELWATYKPDPRAYEGAARLLGLRPDQVMMVAAHPSDLAAAARCGLRTAFVPRPLEWGPLAGLPSEDVVADVVAADFGSLADALGT